MEFRAFIFALSSFAVTEYITKNAQVRFSPNNTVRLDADEYNLENSAEQHQIEHTRYIGVCVDVAFSVLTDMAMRWSGIHVSVSVVYN